MEERHTNGMLARALREGSEVQCLLDHDHSQVLGSTKGGSLRLTLERVGLRAEVDIADSAPGRRLARELAEACCHFPVGLEREKYWD
jgi:phage head maturation protease